MLAEVVVRWVIGFGGSMNVILVNVGKGQRGENPSAIVEAVYGMCR